MPAPGTTVLFTLHDDSVGTWRLGRSEASDGYSPIISERRELIIIPMMSIACDEGVRLFAEQEHPEFAKKFELQTLFEATLPWEAGKKIVHTVEKEVASFSRDGDVQFRECIRSGVGFHRRGFWAPHNLWCTPVAALDAHGRFLEEPAL